MGIPRGVIQVHEVTLVVIHTFPPYMTATDGILVDCVLLPPHIEASFQSSVRLLPIT
jgi:hypothetical protein